MKLLGTVLLLLMVLTGCGQRQVFQKMEGAVWGTTFHITYQSVKPLDDSIRAIMDGVDRSLSLFNPSSTVSQINQGRGVEVDSLIEKVFYASLKLNGLTAGMFDPTIGPLTNLYGFGTNKAHVLELPSQERIDSVERLIGIKECKIIDGRMYKKSPATSFDFSSIAKGLGCDLIGQMLERNGSKNYMVEIGGEMALLGKNPRGEEWHVMIDAPVDNNKSVTHDCLSVVTPGAFYKDGRCGVATSGNYRNYYKTASGSRINHIIDATTGLPSTTPTLSATVVAGDCMTADGLATACMLMKPKEAVKMIRRIPNTSVLLVVGDTVLTAGNCFKPLTCPYHNQGHPDSCPHNSKSANAKGGKHNGILKK